MDGIDNGTLWNILAPFLTFQTLLVSIIVMSFVQIPKTPLKNLLIHYIKGEEAEKAAGLWVDLIFSLLPFVIGVVITLSVTSLYPKETTGTRFLYGLLCAAISFYIFKIANSLLKKFFDTSINGNGNGNGNGQKTEDKEVEDKK